MIGSWIPFTKNKIKQKETNKKDKFVTVLPQLTRVLGLNAIFTLFHKRNDLPWIALLPFDVVGNDKGSKLGSTYQI